MKKAVIMAAITLALALTIIPTSAFGYHGEEGNYHRDREPKGEMVER